MRKPISKSLSKSTASDKNEYGYQAIQPQTLRTKFRRQILKMYDDGFTPGEITKALRIPESVVRLVICELISEVA